MALGRVSRRATKSDPDSESRESRLLTEWRALDAYVLLGDPGAGKSWALQDECREVDGLWLDARNVVAGIVPSDIAGRTVFIDALDEVRAGTSDGGTVPFDAIRKWLHGQGRPRFRLSCREADWRGPIDGKRLKEVAPLGEVAELHLDPLSDEDVEAVVRSRPREVPDADAFIAAAEQNGLRELLRNPLLLDLTIKAQAGGSGPRTRAAIYEAACRQLATEHNDEHLGVKPVRPGDVERLLDDAGSICAIVVLSGQRGLASGSANGQGSFSAVDLCTELKLHDANAALASKVFVIDSGLAVPRHRSIAEYLGGRALARRISQGLPVGRVLALMQGIDGLPVEPLRGLWAWLALHHAPSRARLIEIDPLGFVLNGDAAELVTAERRDLLHALRAAMERDPWLRGGSWVSHPFGPLATQGLAVELEVLLREARRDQGHLRFIGCLFKALRHGEPLPDLGPVLIAWIEDATAPRHTRVAAYQAWKHCVGFSHTQALAWLKAIDTGVLPDADDELCGTLLRDLYPLHLPPDRVFDHWHRAKQRNHFGKYHSFWRDELWAQTPPDAYPALVRAWLARKAEGAPDLRAEDGTDLAALLAPALEHAGEDATDTTLYDWMGVALDEYGFSRLEDQQHAVRDWLSQRPQRMKAILALGLSKITPDEQGRWAFWQAESRLHGAARPRDWLYWLLDQAESAESSELAQYGFFPAAHAAIAPVTGMDAPSMEQVQAWVERHKDRWPQAERWLEEAWSMPIDHWQGDHERRRKQHRAQEFDAEARRRQALEPQVPALLDGTAPPGLLYHVAVAHEQGFTDVQGESPLERVRNYLVSDEATAQWVIDALPRVLDRDDLPSVDEAIALEAKGKQHYIRPAALLAARLVHARDPQAVLSWPQALAERLVAYYLTDGTGNMPGWYRMLAQHRPGWVAPVLVRYAQPKFRGKGNQFFAGLWALSSEADHVPLARLALPALLDGFPLRASEAARGVLNRTLLPALSLLDPKGAAALVRLRLRQTAMDPMQRICWLVADLPYRAGAAKELAALVGRNERRAVMLGAALYEQGSRLVQQVDPDAVKHLIEMLAPITSRDRGRDGWVTVAHHRSDTMHSLLAALSSNPSDSAKAALLALSQARSLDRWREDIRYALRTQAAHIREARYTVPSPREVALTLACQAPANPADLRALVVQHLDDLQSEWRGKNSFALKWFWREAGKTPEVENECRDLLLDRLGERLKPLNIHVGRECSAARDKRMDMCVEFMRDGRRIALPIEVKKEGDDHLWTAWRDQLETLYSIDPDAQGFGLYLVLWFAVRVDPHPEGLKPRSAEQLRSALTERIPPESRHRLAVHVLDLSWPSESA